MNPTITSGAAVSGNGDDATVAEREARGKAARSETPRSAHGDWEPQESRRDPLELLAEQAENRVEELVPIRYGRMAASPFAFFRGAARVMAADLAETSRSGFSAQLCGDAHLSNFGGFAAPDRRLVFDLNDFDETLTGPWEWDVKRLAASIAIAARERNVGAKRRRGIVARAAESYRLAMRRFASMRNLEVWYSRVEFETVLAEYRDRIDPAQLHRTERNLEKARRKDSMRALAKLTTVEGGERRLVSDPPLIERGEDLAEAYGLGHREGVDARIRELLASYRHTLRDDLRQLLEGYRYADCARKVVGVGSVGTRVWIVLLLGRDDGDPLFLQVKEADRSVLEPFGRRSGYANQGQRVVEGQRLMQATGDLLLGWVRAAGLDGLERDFYVRQLWDWKASAEVDAMDPPAMTLYGRLCGTTLARAHACSGDRLAIAGYLGSGRRFDHALADFAESYADQNERDHGRLVAAIRAGRVEAQLGV